MALVGTVIIAAACPLAVWMIFAVVRHQPAEFTYTAQPIHSGPSNKQIVHPPYIR
jgi:hypothetical protein